MAENYDAEDLTIYKNKIQPYAYEPLPKKKRGNERIENSSDSDSNTSSSESESDDSDANERQPLRNW